MTTSPSINPDYPTTEPRLRAALPALVAARAAGDADGAGLVSELDLFLRLCPAPTIGVTGTKGKTTTSSLTAAILAADPAHPAVLGGNIGIPLVERLPELTPDHRVVYELSELQLPTLSRGTTVAVYTNVTADHLDRHGSLEAYRAVKRRLAELVDPDGALVLNAEDPVVAAYAGLGAAPDRPATGATGRCPAASASSTAGSWPPASSACRWPAAGPAATGPGGRIMPIGELAIPGAHNVCNALAAVAVGLLFGIAPDAIRAAAAAFTGVEHRLEPVARHRRRPLRQRLAGHPARRGHRRAARLRGADRADRRRPRQGRRPRRAGRRRRRAGRRGRRHRRERPGPRAPLPRGRLERGRDARATLDDAVARADALAREALAGGRPARPGPATVLLSPAAASFDMFVDYAARGRAFKAAVAALAAATATDREGPMNLAPPIPRFGRGPADPEATPERDARPRRPPVGQPDPGQDRRPRSSSASATSPTT